MSLWCNRPCTGSMRHSPLLWKSWRSPMPAARPAKAGITSSANRRSERSVCSWGNVPLPGEETIGHVVVVAVPQLGDRAIRHLSHLCLLCMLLVFRPRQSTVQDCGKVSPIRRVLNLPLGRHGCAPHLRSAISFNTAILSSRSSQFLGYIIACGIAQASRLR